MYDAPARSPTYITRWLIRTTLLVQNSERNYETIIVNEAQVPPTGLLCEV